MTAITKQTLRINLFILLAYTVILHIAYGQETLVISMLPIILHVGINLVAGVYFFIVGKSENGKAFMLSTFLVLLIGFGTCWLSAGVASSWDESGGNMFH